MLTYLLRIFSTTSASCLLTRTGRPNRTWHCKKISAVLGSVHISTSTPYPRPQRRTCRASSTVPSQVTATVLLSRLTTVLIVFPSCLGCPLIKAGTEGAVKLVLGY